MEPNNDLASQEALKATFELIAAKSVTRALKARTGLAGAAKNFAKQVGKRGMSVPTWIAEKFVQEAWDIACQQAYDKQKHAAESAV